MSPLNIEAVLLLSLATWRLAYMLVHEDGPGEIFDRLRRIANRIPVIDDLFACIYCMSVWIALLLYGLSQSETGQHLIYILAFSAIAILIHEWRLPRGNDR